MHAQAYPTKPVTIVVTLAAGGAADVIARALAQRLTEEWGQPVLVENKGGANNQVGTTAVARSAPDGYTLLLTPEHTFTVNPYLYRKLSYDPAKDFVPVTGLVSISQALVVHPSLAVRTVADLIAAAKDNPGQLNYGSLGVGSGPHLSMELLQSMTGAKLNAVQYKGAAPALTDVIAGHIPMMFVSTGLIVQPWKAGQLRALGVGSRERLIAVSRLADGRRDPAGLYRARLVRSVRAKWNAAGHRRQDQQCGSTHAGGSRLSAAVSDAELL